MRDTSFRREQILSLLKTNGSVQVRALSEQYDVSTVTIRRDLKFLEDIGIATRAYGGAMLIETSSETENPLSQKQKLNTSTKASIAKLAASLVQPGDSIILDSGTTTNHMIAFLGDVPDLTIITNDLTAINRCAEMENAELIVLGGIFRRKSLFLYGLHSDQSLKELNVDKLFLGVDGFHMAKGITTFFEPEATLNRAMCQAASEVIVVTDSSKFYKVCLHKIIEPTAITTVITDDGIPKEYLDGLRALNIDVQLVKNVD